MVALTMLGGSGAGAVPGPTSVGFNDYFRGDSATTIAAARSAGASLARVDACRWSQVEATQGSYDWSGCDAVLNKVTAQGLAPIVIAWDAPAWARPANPASGADAYPPDPPYDGQWQSYISALVTRYPGMRAIEVWSEPNNCRAPYPCEWGGPIDPARYLTLLREADAAAHRASSSAVVLSAGLAPITSGSGTYGGDQTWTSYFSSLAASGLSSSADGIGMHPYPSDLSSASAAASSVDQQMTSAWNALKAGCGCSPHQHMWVTEVGVSSGDLGGGAAGEAGQAAYVNAIWNDLVAAHPWGLQSVLWFDLWDGTYGPQASWYGWLRTDGTPKPVYCQMGRLYTKHTMKGCPAA